MEKEKKGQVSNKNIASGFFTLRDKHGNLVGQTVAMNQDKQLTAGQDLAFHPCQKIQNALTENDVLLPHENGFAINLSQVKIESLQQLNQATVTAGNTLGQQQGKNR